MFRSESDGVLDSIQRSPLFSPEECEVMRSAALALPGWQRSAVLGRHGEVFLDPSRSSWNVRVTSLDEEPFAASALRPFAERLRDFALEADARFLQLGSRSLQELQLIRYRPGGGFWWHCDAVDRAFRKVSVLCYLNDFETDGLQGGETVFAPRLLQPLLRRSRMRALLKRAGVGELIPTGWSQPPQAGQAVAFPSALVHRGREVEQGEKLLIAMFLV